MALISSNGNFLAYTNFQNHLLERWPDYRINISIIIETSPIFKNCMKMGEVGGGSPRKITKTGPQLFLERMQDVLPVNAGCTAAPKKNPFFSGRSTALYFDDIRIVPAGSLFQVHIPRPVIFGQ